MSLDFKLCRALTLVVAGTLLELNLAPAGGPGGDPRVFNELLAADDLYSEALDLWAEGSGGLCNACVQEGAGRAAARRDAR